MTRFFETVHCPLCGKQLVDLREGDPFTEEGEHCYWCDHCDIDITIMELPHEDKDA